MGLTGIFAAVLLFDINAAFVHDDAIPRVVYKTGRYLSESSFPPGLRTAFVKNRNQNPGYQFLYLNDTSLHTIIEEYPGPFGPNASLLVRSLRPGAYRSDIFRLAILWAEGGIYSDLPQTYARPLDEIVNHGSSAEHFFAVDRPTEMFASLNKSDFLYGLQTSFLAAPPRSPLILHLLRSMLTSVRLRDYGRNPLDISGPVAAYRHIAAILGLSKIDPRSWDHLRFACELKNFFELVRCVKIDGADRKKQSIGRVVDISVHVGLQHSVDITAGPRLTQLCGERQIGNVLCVPSRLEQQNIQVASHARKNTSNSLSDDFNSNRGKASSRVRPVCVDGSDAVYVFGVPGRTKKEKNILVYRSALAAKRDHYDRLWKERQVFVD
mmetsp:Transcript_47573/g.88591  ORF Transcript_47573/g.88591 Transcript_47573/m.88591 type:complete len:381 (-) Transcript_47573:419-1561(-)